MIRITKHLDFYWPTTDDWYPCWPRQTVRVQVSEIDAMVRVSFWGADDFGLERDVPNPTPEMVEQQINWAKLLPNPVTQQWLRDHGFVNA